MDRTKKILISMLVLGALAAVGAGTYATFNAQTTNSGNTFSTGTILLSETQNAYSACLSYDIAAGFTNNNQSTCANPLMTVSGARPGTPTAAGLVFKNTGTLNAASLVAGLSGGCSSNHAALAPVYGNGDLCAAGGLVAAIQELAVGPVLGTQLTNAASVSSINIAPATVGQALPNASLVMVVNSTGNTQAFVTNGITLSGATSINVQTVTANATYLVTDKIYLPIAGGCKVGDTETVGTVNANACTFDAGPGITTAAVVAGDTLSSIYNTGSGVNLGTLNANTSRYYAFALGIPNLTTAQNSIQGLCLGATTACGGLSATWTIQ